MSNATGSSRESNPSGRICILCAAPLRYVADCFVITWLFVCLSCIVGSLFDQETRNKQKDKHLIANEFERVVCASYSESKSRGFNIQ